MSLFDEKNNAIRSDTSVGDSITAELVKLLNRYPDLLPGEKIVFAYGLDKGNILVFPIQSALVIDETEDILGNHKENCQYTVMLIYKVGRDSSGSRVAIADFLASLGNWVEQQDYKHMTFDIDIDIISIKRTSIAYLDSVEEDGVENWAQQLTVYYTREYQK